MAQHDYVIDNNSGFGVRTDINNALSAIKSNNSGAGEPANPTEGMTWYDTQNKVTKRRNASGGWDIIPSYNDAIAMAIALS